MFFVRLCLVGSLLVLLCSGTPLAGAGKRSIPDPAIDDALSAANGSSSAVLAGGCFWGMEEVFRHVRGVMTVTSGYAGGSLRTATYDLVSTGTTGHAESVKIVYNPASVSFGQLLKVFFAVAHDPTQRNAQWPDEGPEYRSVIFYVNERQQELARAYMSQLQDARVFRHPIATDLVPLAGFYEAEAYHQNFAARHPTHPYIVQIDLPKLEDLRKELPDLYVK
jgi:peptide-methionine (S)-S-oxide reductase